jgi:glycerol-3-phosphate acyltransferase PlsY
MNLNDIGDLLLQNNRMFYILFAAVIGYLLGSLNSSLIVGKFYGVDVRKKGSGNAGTTNTLRTLGKKAAFFTAAGDVLKCIIACLLGGYILKLSVDTRLMDFATPVALETYKDFFFNIGIMVGGVAATVGHNWPIYFKFKGGKGILTTFTVIIMMDWRIAILLFGIFLIIVAITRYVSLGSVICVVALPFVSIIPFFEKYLIFTVFSAILAILAVIRHRHNIVRIAFGTEAKINLGKGFKKD